MAGILFVCLLFNSQHLFSSEVDAQILTPEERQWLDKHPEVKLLVLSNQPPFSSKDAQGQASGILPDLINEISRRIGHEIKTEFPKKNVPAHLQSKSAGIYGNAAILATPKNQAEYLLTEAYYSTPFYIFTHESQLEALKELESRLRPL